MEASSQAHESQAQRPGYSSLLSRSQIAGKIHDASPFSGTKHAGSVPSHSAMSMGSAASRFNFYTRELEEQHGGGPLAFGRKTAGQAWGGSEGIN